MKDGALDTKNMQQMASLDSSIFKKFAFVLDREFSKIFLSFSVSKYTFVC